VAQAAVASADDKQPSTPKTARRRRLTTARREQIAGFLFSLPGLVLLLFFLVIPFFLAIGLSFTNQRLASPIPLRWEGFSNYTDTLSNADFWKAFFNNVWFVAIVVPLQTSLALWLATLVNQKLRGLTVYRAIYFTPVVIIMAVAATVWLLIFSPDRGLANGFLRFVTFGNVESEFLDSTTWALPSIMLMSIWQGVGFQMIIILAGLQEIPNDLYEAASIDGASRWEQFRYVTLPLLRNTLIFVVTVTTILAFRLFDQIWVMTRGEPLGNTSTIMLEMVQVGFERQQIARASAIAVIFFLIVLTVTLVQRALIKEERY
jgi:multiple sugar transport system permease protein